MSTTGFNLLTDPWIPVGSDLVSIEQALAGAHELDGWPCSDPALAEALVRLLVPMVYRITGLDDPSLTRDAFAGRQRELLERGRFKPSSVSAYLARYEDRFWLINPPEGCMPFAQDPALVAVEPHPVSKAVPAWASGNNPALGPHAPSGDITPEAAAQNLLVQRCYSYGGRCTSHPRYEGPNPGAFDGAPLRDTVSVHPVGATFAATLAGNLVPLPYDTGFGEPFWESAADKPLVPPTARSGLLEQIAVRQDKTMLYRSDDAGAVNGFTIAKGGGVHRRLFCRDPYWLVGEDGEAVKPREGRDFWREAESLLDQGGDGTRASTIEILEWSIGEHGWENYPPTDFAWVAISHRGNQSTNRAWFCSHAPHLRSIFARDAEMRCKEFLSVANEAEHQMAKQLAKVWHSSGLMPSDAGSKAAVYTPARAQFWRLAEADFWETARFGVPADGRDARLRTHALAGFDLATARLLHDRRSHRAVVESRRWLERWNRRQDAVVNERQEAP